MIQPVGFPKLPAEFEYDTEVHDSLDKEHSIFMNFFRKRKTHPKRALLVVHGLGEHGGRYQHFAHYLKDTYDLILAVDLRGHGRSEGVRGHVDRFDEYVDDVLLAWEVLQKKCSPETRIDLFGHSMGGLVVLRTLLYRPDLEVQHVILSSPLVANKVAVSLGKEVAAKILSKVWGSLQLPTDIDAKTISHDANVVAAYQKDRLVHSKATPAFYFSMKDAMKELIDKSIRPKADTKMLLQVAADDLIVDSEASARFFENMRHDNKKVITYPGLYHEIYNETTKEMVFDDLKRFVETP